MWKSLVLKKSPCFNCLLIWRQTSSAIFLRCSLVFYSLSPKIFSEFSTRKAGEAKVKKLEQQLKKLLGFDPSPFGEVNVCLVFFFSISPGRGVDVFFSGVFFGAFFLLGDFVLRTKCRWIQKSRDVSEKLLGLCRGIICILIWATNCSKVNAPWYKISLKNPRTARNNSVKNFTLLRNLPLLPGLIMSPIVCPHRLPHLPFFTNLTRIFRPKIFEPAGSLGKFAYESGKNAVNIFGTSWFCSWGTNFETWFLFSKWGTKDIAKAFRRP